MALRRVVGIVMAVLAGMVVAVATEVPSQGQGAATIEEFGPKPQNVATDRFYVSPKGQNVALVRNSGSRRVVTINGVDGEIYDEVMALRPANPALMTRGDYGEVLFSPDGKRYAYRARRGTSWFVVVDGTAYPYEQPEHSSLSSTEFVFSPDSSRFGYIARHQGEDSLVIDGTVVGPTGGRVYTPTGGRVFEGEAALVFSPDGRRYAYRRQAGTEYSMVVDGEPGPARRSVSQFQFSPDSTRYLYVVAAEQSNSSSYEVVVDGKLLPLAVRQMQAPIFAPVGNRYAYVGETRSADPRGVGSQQLVVDGEPGQSFFRIGDFAFSPDGTRVAYAAEIGPRSGRAVLMVDGKQVGQEYAVIQRVTFTGDGRRVLAQGRSTQWFQLVDDTESEEYIDISVPVVNSTSGAFAYSGRTNAGTFITTSLSPTPTQVSEVTAIQVSPVGDRVAFTGTVKYPDSIVSIDGKTQPFQLHQFVAATRRFFVFSPDGSHVAYVGRANDTQATVVVLDGEASAGGSAFDRLMFSDDSRHFAFTGRFQPQGKPVVVLNGIAVGEWDELFLNQPETWGFTADGKLQVIGVRGGQLVRATYTPAGTLADFRRNAARLGPAASTNR